MRIVLGMSGGLDSTYAALKLIEEGHSVEGAVLIMHDHTDLCAARKSAKEINIPLHEIDCREAFFAKVVPDFARQYRLGRTPNPCIVCNREVKFRVLYDYAVANGFDKIATGHYAKILEVKNEKDRKCKLMCANDAKKDQTYMLWRVPREIIDFLILPLGDLKKEEIRESAREKGISAAVSRDSQEICFIPDGNHGAYIEEHYGKSKAGHFVDTEGNILGEHKGIVHYTIGQRKGLGVALGQRAFITDIDPLTDRITLSFETRQTSEFSVSDIIFSGMEEMEVGESVEVYCKVRYQAPLIKATVAYLGEGRGSVILESPARSVTAGQSAVFYRDGVLLFGGFID